MNEPKKCPECGDPDECEVCGDRKHTYLYLGNGEYGCPIAHKIAIERGEEIKRLKRIAKSALTQDNRNDMESCSRMNKSELRLVEIVVDQKNEFTLLVGFKVTSDGKEYAHSMQLHPNAPAYELVTLFEHLAFHMGRIIRQQEAE